MNRFKIGACGGLDWNVAANAPILKRLIAVNTLVSPGGREDPWCRLFFLGGRGGMGLVLDSGSSILKIEIRN